MQAMPQTTEIVKVVIGEVGERVETESVSGNVVVEVVSDDGSLVKGDESVPRFGSKSEVENIGKREQ
jgi:hypothetical protein